MKVLLLWVGPVSAANLAKVRWSSPTTVVTVNRGAGDPNPIGSTAFRNLAASYGADGLRKLFLSKGYDPSTFDRVVVGTFSAGWGLVNHFLKDPASRDLVTCVAAFDSYYYGVVPGVLDGYYEFSKLARYYPGKFAWFSSSGFRGPGYLASDEAIEPMLKALNLLPSALPLALQTGALPAPRAVLEGGHFLYADWAVSLAHAEHATRVAPVVFERLVSPVMAGLPLPTKELPVGAPMPPSVEPAVGPPWYERPLPWLGLGAAAGIAYALRR